jgi:hypothetical protein
VAHTNDLNAARKAVEEVEDPFDKATLHTEIAKASAYTDIATALENIAYEYAKTVR